MSSIPARTLKNGNPPCPRCKGDRCLIFWGGEDCSLCVGGFYEWRGNKYECKFCDNGKRRPRVLCNRDGQKWFDLNDLPDGYTPVIKPSSPRATDARVDLIYTAFLSRCHLTDNWRRHLVNERKLSTETIQMAGFVTLPCRKVCDSIADSLAKSHGALVGVPGFYEHEGKWGFRRTLPNWESGLVIPYRNLAGEVVMLQVRTDSTDPKKRYMCISGAPSYVSHAGTGSGAPAHWVAGTDTSVVGITEGGLKAIAIDNHWRSLGLPPMRWIGLCGLSVPGGFITDMRARLPRATRLVLAFDREVKDSDAWQSVERVKRILREAETKWGLSVGEVRGWPEGSAAKFDDYLRGLL